MSKENDLTIEIYNQFAKNYVANSRTKENEDLAAARIKNEQLNNFLIYSFSSLKEGATIIEVGAGGGENSLFLKKCKYNIVATDASISFVEILKEMQLNTFQFNVLTSDYRQKYDGILCWRVFVHFTLHDAKIALQKSYNALNNGGILVFNAMNREMHEFDSEWLDFSGSYHLGKERYYQYYRHNDLDKLIEDIGFEVLDFHTEGGDGNNKWLIYVLKRVYE